MEASLTPTALRKLTRSLACLARFGETVTLLALPSELVLTTLSASKTAHGKVTLAPDFFEAYTLAAGAPRRGVTCDLNLKALLGVLRLRAGEKLDACELRLVDPEQLDRPSGHGRGGRAREPKRRRVNGENSSQGEEEEDSDDDDDDDVRADDGGGRRAVQPRFSIRLTFPGFTKLHALQISTPPPLGVPLAPKLSSHFTTTARAVLSWMDAFPSWSHGGGGGGGGGGAKGADGGAGGSSQEFLAWAFGREGVRISSWAANAKQDQLSTELSVGADAFDGFYLAPTFSASAARDQAVGFPMREFKAVTFLAQHLNLPMTARFAGPFQPLALSLSADPTEADAADADCAFAFLIMTRDVPASAGGRREAKAERAAGGGGDGKAEVRPSGGRRLRLASGETSQGLGGRGGGAGARVSSAARAEDDESGMEAEPDADDDDRGGGMECDPAAAAYDDAHDGRRSIPPAASVGGARRTNASAGPSNQADLTFSHPLAHSTLRGALAPAPAAAREPLFYPGSQAERPAGSQFPTQLTQAELADLGLGGLDDVDFAMGEEVEWDVAGDVGGLGGEAQRDGGADVVGGTQIAQTQIAGSGRAFTRFEGGESDEELDEPDTAAAVAVGEAGGVRTQVGDDGSDGDEGKAEAEPYETSVDV